MLGILHKPGTVYLQHRIDRKINSKAMTQAGAFWVSQLQESIL